MNTIQIFLLRTPRSLKDYNNMCVDPSIRMSQTDSYWNVSRGLVTALWLGRWTLSLNIGWHIFLFFRSTFSSTLRSTAYPSCPHVACVLLVTFLSLSFLSAFCFLYPAADAAAGGPHGCQSRRLPGTQRGLSHHPDPPDGGAQYQQPAAHPHDPGVGWVSSDTGWATALHFLSYGMGSS